MRTQLEIKGLRFNDFESKVCVMANVIKNNLSYWTTIFIEMHDLNKLINHLQRNNPEVDLYEKMQSTNFGDYTEYEIELGQEMNSFHTLEDLFGNEKQVRLIRA